MNWKVSRVSGVAAALLLLAAGPAWATAINGRVTSTSGTGLAGVDLDFIDRNTGLKLPLIDDNTDLLGFYSVSVPAGDYDVRFTPPVGARLVGEEVRMKPQGAVMTWNQVLESGWFLTGRLVDDLGAPVPAVDLDLVDTVDGPQFTAHDATLADGTFAVVLLPAIYDVEFEPTLGVPLAPRRLEALAVAGDLPLGDIVLQPGHVLSGRLTAAAGGTVAGAVVQLLDPATSLEIFAIRNVSDALGQFATMVAAGSYTLRVVPAQGAPFLPRLVAGVTLAAPLALADIPLDAGAVISGLVTDNGSDPVTGVDLDFFAAWSGTKQFSPADNTNDSGIYTVTVRPGTYDMTFDPPAGSGLTPARLQGVVLGASQTLPQLTLVPGFEVSGVVTSAAAAPLVGVDLDFTSVATGAEVYTAGDDTGIGGVFSVVVAAASYDIRFTPPAGSGSDQAILAGVTVAGILNLGTVSLGSSTPASVSGILPPSGSAAGGTLVTVTGAAMVPGVRVQIGGVPLSGQLLLDPFTVQGITSAHPDGNADVVVTNPGAPPAVLVGGYTFIPAAVDPVLSLSLSGPTGTDIDLAWSSTGQALYSVFRSTNPATFGLNERIDVVEGSTLRDEGAALMADFIFYAIH